jgi:prefoldin subunit 5
VKRKMKENQTDLEEIILQLQQLLEEIIETRRKIEQALQPYTYNQTKFYAEPS